MSVRPPTRIGFDVKQGARAVHAIMLVVGIIALWAGIGIGVAVLAERNVWYAVAFVLFIAVATAFVLGGLTRERLEEDR